MRDTLFPVLKTELEELLSDTENALFIKTVCAIRTIQPGRIIFVREYVQRSMNAKMMGEAKFVNVNAIPSDLALTLPPERLLLSLESMHSQTLGERSINLFVRIHSLPNVNRLLKNPPPSRRNHREGAFLNGEWSRRWVSRAAWRRGPRVSAAICSVRAHRGRGGRYAPDGFGGAVSISFAMRIKLQAAATYCAAACVRAMPR
jgi:hypothetical protein